MQLSHFATQHSISKPDDLAVAAEAEELLDEAADIDVHPDELEAEQRLDDDPQAICEIARKALHQSPYKELHRLSIRVSGERINILGQTTTFFLKQMAQEVVRQATPGMGVDNLVGVRHLTSPHFAAR